MKSLLSIALFAAFPLMAEDCHSVTQVDGVPHEVSVDKAQTMGLNRADSFTVYTVSGKSKLEQLVYNKLKEKNIEYYSVAYVVPRSDNSNYQAIVTSYYDKIE